YHRQNRWGAQSLSARKPIGPRGSTQPLHDGEQLVFYGRRKKGSSRSGPVSRLGCSLCRLLFHSRGGDQASRIGTHDRRWEDRLRHRRILKPCASSAAGEPKLVADQRVRRLSESLKRSAGGVTFCKPLTG